MMSEIDRYALIQARESWKELSKEEAVWKIYNLRREGRYNEITEEYLSAGEVASQNATDRATKNVAKLMKTEGKDLFFIAEYFYITPKEAEKLLEG